MGGVGRRDAVGVSPLIRQGHASGLLAHRLLGELSRRLSKAILADAFDLLGQRVPPRVQQRVVRRRPQADILPPLILTPRIRARLGWRPSLLPRSLGHVLGGVGEGIPPYLQ